MSIRADSPANNTVNCIRRLSGCWTHPGFFTLAGIRSYELFGKGIVLATRYESLRKIYRIPGRGHLICLKSTVYEGLPPRYQKEFSRFDLDQSQQFIRDDEAVHDFYYQRISSAWRQDESA
ncbi:MAG TPA: hypothetical protein VE954_36560 [Oligoflexus sp.]|uniref:hypothetical protein n=1 Tax=Oligoflexus sp. TaxID=1971216 RepID=UPI002D288308|nr:hypothetical protein [Oligoflexus sp.]HYX38649.1 hypothetical protein [Oligoflexus sp.]